MDQDQKKISLPPAAKFKTARIILTTLGLIVFYFFLTNGKFSPTEDTTFIIIGVPAVIVILVLLIHRYRLQLRSVSGQTMERTGTENNSNLLGVTVLKTVLGIAGFTFIVAGFGDLSLLGITGICLGAALLIAIWSLSKHKGWARYFALSVLVISFFFSLWPVIENREVLSPGIVFLGESLVALLLLWKYWQQLGTGVYSSEKKGIIQSPQTIPWNRIATDFNVLQGGFVTLGLVGFFGPIIGSTIFGGGTLLLTAYLSFLIAFGSVLATWSLAKRKTWSWRLAITMAVANLLVSFVPSIDWIQLIVAVIILLFVWKIWREKTFDVWLRRKS